MGGLIYPPSVMWGWDQDCHKLWHYTFDFHLHSSTKIPLLPPTPPPSPRHWGRPGCPPTSSCSAPSYGRSQRRRTWGGHRRPPEERRDVTWRCITHVIEMVLELLSGLEVCPEREVVFPGTLAHVHALKGGGWWGQGGTGRRWIGVRKEVEGDRKEVEGDSKEVEGVRKETGRRWKETGRRWKETG